MKKLALLLMFLTIAALAHGPTMPPPCCDPYGTGKTDCCPS